MMIIMIAAAAAGAATALRLAGLVTRPGGPESLARGVTASAPGRGRRHGPGLFSEAVLLRLSTASLSAQARSHARRPGGRYRQWHSPSQAQALGGIQVASATRTDGDFSPGFRRRPARGRRGRRARPRDRR